SSMTPQSLRDDRPVSRGRARVTARLEDEFTGGKECAPAHAAGDPASRRGLAPRTRRGDPYAAREARSSTAMACPSGAGVWHDDERERWDEIASRARPGGARLRSHRGSG